MNEKRRKRVIAVSAGAAAVIAMSGVAWGLWTDAAPAAAATAQTATADSDAPTGSEEALTGDLAERVTAAAEAAVPGGTVVRVETDDHGAAYEAHMIDADGNPVTVSFDEDLNVIATETDGPGFGHRHRGGGDELESEA